MVLGHGLIPADSLFKCPTIGKVTAQEALHDCFHLRSCILLEEEDEVEVASLRRREHSRGLDTYYGADVTVTINRSQFG
jgi:hypothetical protein